MPNHILVANRGEIAIRVLRTATDLNLETTAVYATDDADSLHTRHADHAENLGGEGVSAYLDSENIIAIAAAGGCDAVQENDHNLSICLHHGPRCGGPHAAHFAISHRLCR